MATNDEENKAKPSSPDDLSDIDSLNSSDSEDENGSDRKVAKKRGDEPVEWLATSRAKRSTAGNRMKSMLAHEEPAAEDSDLELLFAEDEDDAGFTDDANANDSDVVMDSSSDDEDEQNNADDLEGEKELERQAKEKKNASRKRKTQEAIPAKFRKKVRIEPPTQSASPRSTTVTPRPPRPKKKSERASWLPSPADMPVRASERSTTRISKQQLHQKMVTDEIRRKKQLEKMEKKAKLLEALKKPPMTQAERLAEAALVEKRNSKSLNRWEEAEKSREEERMRKIAALNNRKLDGPVVTFWSGIQELTDAQGNHVGNLVSMEVKAPRKKRQSAAAVLAAKEAAANGEVPGTPTTPSTPVDTKEKEGVKTDGKGDVKMVDAPASATEVKTEKTEGSAVENVPAGGQPGSAAAAAVPSTSPALAVPSEISPAAVPVAGSTPTPVPVSAPASSAPVAAPTSVESTAASAPTSSAPVSIAPPPSLVSPVPAPIPSTVTPIPHSPALAPPASTPAVSTPPPLSVSPVPVPAVPAPPLPTSLATAPPPSMAPPPIPPPPDTRPSNSGVLAAPILAPPVGSPMLGAQMPMLGFPAGKFNGLAPPNTAHTPSPLSMPPSIPAAVQTPAKPKPTLITSPPASKPPIQPPPLPNTPATPATPLTSATSTKGKSSIIPPTPVTLPPDTPRSATEPPREGGGGGGKVTRSCIILQNFDETAIKDKQIQTQILFGRKMTRLAKPATPPVCVITGHPAKYRDPKTGLPYYNSYAYREIQRVHRGDYKWSGLIGAYVGRGDYAARGVPDRFRDPSLPGPVKKAEPVLVPIDGAEEVNKEGNESTAGEKKSPSTVEASEPRLELIDAPPPKEGVVKEAEAPKEAEEKVVAPAAGAVPAVASPPVAATTTAAPISQEVKT
ncbi:YL1 nuclear protein-domain-containing protein [Podospora australis]|uniref:YL1 nuclear protein-domain-containing protein n=1 Tax=Podospora australis TaxID=1536484 RepID=A0AAN6WRP0_9PEZI|nr:YL1 nuclear protein-domain-containing protein [Podospora australis]